MKRMNFINKISAHRHQEATRWFTLSSTALGVTLVSIIVLQGLESYELYATRAQLVNAQTRLDAALPNAQEKQTLEGKKNTLANLRTHIYCCTLTPCNPHDTLCLLTKLSKLPVTLQSVQLHPEGVDMTAHAHNAQHATRAMAQLKQENLFKNLELVSITPSQKGVLFRVKGLSGVLR